MKNLLVLTFLIASISSIVKGADPQEIEGRYLGRRCGVEATIVGNRMRFTIVTKNGVVAEDTIPLFKFETIESENSFSFEREVFGATGEEVKVLAGTIYGGRLESLVIKTKLSGLLNNTSKSCRNLSPQGRF